MGLATSGIAVNSILEHVNSGGPRRIGQGGHNDGAAVPSSMDGYVERGVLHSGANLNVAVVVRHICKFVDGIRVSHLQLQVSTYTTIYSRSSQNSIVTICVSVKGSTGLQADGVEEI